MFSKTSLIVALTAAAAPQLALAASVPSQSFKYSEVVVQADVSTPDFVRTMVAEGENGNASELTRVVTDTREFVSGAIANIQSRFVGDVFLMSGTSHDVSTVANEDCVIIDEPSPIFPAFYHEIRTAIDATKTTIYSIFVSPDATDIGFDRELLASLEIKNTNGDVVDISDQLAALDADPTATLLEIELAPGSYHTFVGVGSGHRTGDDEFQLRSTVVAAPTPSAALAGLLGLGALTKRRRKLA